MPASHDDALAMPLAGESVFLLGTRALYWPARHRLVIADLHLGKGHVFRRAGIAVPSGTTGDDLLRLETLLIRTGARELWIVGDLLHGPAAQAGWRDDWLLWRQRHAMLAVAVLPGNHDRALAQADLGVTCLAPVMRDGPFVFQHMPQPDPEGRHVIAGHVHPKTRVPGVSRSWPAFWLTPGLTVLPAFSDFTGGQLVRPGRDDALVACVAGSALLLGGGR